MNGPSLTTEIDANPLVSALVEKTKAGKLNWESTAAPDTYICSLKGDTTFKLTMGWGMERDNRIIPERAEVPVLQLLDAKGHKQWEIHSSDVKGGLWVLYELAQRIANRVDDKIAALVETVERL